MRFKFDVFFINLKLEIEMTNRQSSLVDCTTIGSKSVELSPLLLTGC